jgi:CRISPR-associated protein Cas6
MYWEEENTEEIYQVPDDIVDVVYRMECKTLRVDHAYALSAAIQQVLPWFASEPAAGLHLIHGADSGNGWIRPEDGDDLLYLSRRTRLVLRLPRERLQDAEAMCGQTLDVDGHLLKVGSFSTRLLSDLATLFSRYVALEEGELEDEDAFLRRVAGELKDMGLPVKRILPGITHSIRRPEGELPVRSIMVADLDPESAVILQQRGVGGHRHLGCGLFVPHKGINDILAGKK